MNGCIGSTFQICARFWSVQVRTVSLNQAPFPLLCTCILLVSAVHIGKGYEHLVLFPLYPHHSSSQVWHSSGLFMHSSHHSSPLLIPSTVPKKWSKNVPHHSTMHQSIHCLCFLPSPFQNIILNHDAALKWYFNTTPLSSTSLLLYNVLLADVSMQLLNFSQLLKFPISPGAAIAQDKPKDLSQLYFTSPTQKSP